MLMSAVLVPELRHCSRQWSNICACSGFSLFLGMSNKQMGVLEEIYLMIKMSSWRQNPRVKSGYSMKKYVRLCMCPMSQIKTNEQVSLGYLQERSSAFFLRSI